MPTRTIRYVTALTVAAVGAVAVLLAVVPAPTPTLVEVLLLVGGIALAERTEVAFSWDRTLGGFTLIEVAVVTGLLLLPSSHVTLAVVPAVALAHASAWRTPVKVLYNVATATLGTAVAALVLAGLPHLPPLVDGRSVPAVVVAMVGYGAVAALAFAGLLRQLQGPSTARSLGAQLPLLGASTLGNASIGILFAALLELAPSLAPFVLAPAAAVHLAQRASVRATTSLASQRAEHARLTRVVDGASDGILLLDAHGIVQVWNPAMTRLTGRPAERAVGRPVARILTEEVRTADRPVDGRWTLAEASEHVPVLEQDAQLTDGDGVTRDVRESHAFTFDDRGRCTGAVVVVRDVSRQRELERLRSDFVARVSHELRTPLTPIRGFASMLLRRGEVLDEDQRAEALTRIVERADHLHGLVEDLLLVTRLEHRDVAGLVHAVPTDVAEIVRAAVDEVAVRHTARTVTVATGSAVPLAHADGARVRQILDAVLDNATRYSDPDTPIEVELDRHGDDVRVRVVDHGPGIPPHERDAVFERFHRLEDPLTMRTSGVGVGLFLGRRLAEAMHGSLVVADTPPGDGAVLELRLPTAVPPAGADERTGACDRTSPVSRPSFRSR